MSEEDSSFQRGVKGLVPWTIDGFHEAHDWVKRLHETPKDDWDLRWRSISIVDDETGQVLPVRINPLLKMTQLGNYLRDEYQTHQESFAHMIRFDKILRFIEENDALLRDRDLVKDGDGEGEMVAEELLKTLCTAPYNVVVPHTDDEGDTSCSYEFNVAEIVDRAIELRLESEQ